MASKIESFVVKVRKLGTKKFKFISSGGSINSLRIHAVRFTCEEKAEAFISDNASNNPEYEFKVVSLTA